MGSENLAAVARELDVLGAARDNVHGLYWHTDLERALVRSRARGRPVLSLRLLGRLDEELSCANSRYFRAALYANEAVAALLRDSFVLHWESVRPAPRVTIDFGDGRVVTRTITGNSCHLLLDSEGRPFDVLPGLYGPKAFREQLALAAESYPRIEAAEDAQVDRERQNHAARAANAIARWSAGPTPSPAVARAEPSVLARPLRDALGEPLTVMKFTVESGMRASFDPAIGGWGASRSLGLAFANPETLDATSRGLVRRHGSDLEETAFRERVGLFEQALAFDTAHNQTVLRAEVLRWFQQERPPPSEERLLRRIYDELFLRSRVGSLDGTRRLRGVHGDLARDRVRPRPLGPGRLGREDQSRSRMRSERDSRPARSVTFFVDERPSGATATTR